MVEPSWLGRRVSVRRAVPAAGTGGPRYSDVVGDLLSLTDESALVQTRRGPVEVALAEVAIARMAPPSTADELALEAIAAAGWQPAETGRVGGWLLRAAGGFTARANSVLPLRAAGMPLDEALAAAGAWYADRGLPLKVQLPTQARRLLDAELRERGWPAQAEAQVLAARLDMLRAGDEADAGAARIELADGPDDPWLACYRDGAGLSTVGARELLTRHGRAVFAAAREGAAVIAVGRGVLDEGWLGVSAVEVVPSRRRRGLAGAIMSALWGWGRAGGATRSYLQVESGNTAALALYERLGYWPHHTYHYRACPAPG